MNKSKENQNDKSNRETAFSDDAACCVPESLIHVQGLSISYARKRVLKNVSLTINKGCITTLIGPSGCGKTSFLSSLNRLTDLVSGCVIEGEIQIGSIDVRSPSTNVIGLRSRVGMIFQKPNPFPLSIRRNIELPVREHGKQSRTQLDEIVESVLQDVGLWDEVKDRLDSPALSLSGGQQQRLCIARALALQPEVLLLDEPCSALDPIATEVIEKLITSFSGRLTIVMVTHNLAQARRISDYAAFFWMKNDMGQLIEYGTSKQIFNAPQHALTAAYVNGKKG